MHNTHKNYMYILRLQASMLTKLPLAEAADFFPGDFADFLAGLALVVVAFFALAAVLRVVVFAMIIVLLECENVSLFLCWQAHG